MGKNKEELVHWGVSIPPRTKERFLGACKIKGQDWKKVLANLCNGYTNDVMEEGKVKE